MTAQLITGKRILVVEDEPLIAALLTDMLTADGHVGAGFARSVVQALASAALSPLLYPLLDQSRLFRKALGGREYQFA